MNQLAHSIGRGLWRNMAIALLLLLTAVAGGCQAFKFAAFATAPATEKVDAQCRLLDNHKVLVYVWAPPEVLWDYPKLRLNLSAYVSGYLLEHVENVTVVNYYRVESYIEKNNALEIDPVEIGKHFQADVVLQLDVYKFSIRDPGRAHLYRGRLGAGITVFDLTAEDGADRVPLKDVEIAYPEDRVVGFANARPEAIRQQTFDLFAVEVGKKFHDYERPLD